MNFGVGIVNLKLHDEIVNIYKKCAQERNGILFYFEFKLNLLSYRINCVEFTIGTGIAHLNVESIQTGSFIPKARYAN